jgi:polyisoprenoid-binding protein YceI
MTTWNFDASHSSINFHVRHLMVSKVHGRFTSWTGTLAYDPEDPTRSSVEVVIDAASVDTREPKRDDHLRSEDFFDVVRYPQLTFKSTSVDKTGDDSLDVHGELTIHGVTHPVVLAVELGGVAKDPWGGTRAGFSAKTTISRKDFGLTWNVALETGGILVGDKIEIGLEIEAIQAAQKAA